MLCNKRSHYEKPKALQLESGPCLPQLEKTLSPGNENPMDCSPPGSSTQGFSRQEYWSGLPFPSPGDLLDPGIEPGSPVCRKILYHLSHQESPVKTQHSQK